MPSTEAPEVTNPRRVLAVSLENEVNHLSQVLKDLTGSPPQPTSTTLAGTTHDLTLETPYYTATVPIWIDLIPSSPSSAGDDWADAFLSPEAKEVLGVLGGLILIFALPPSSGAAAAGDGARAKETKDLIGQVGKVAGERGLGGWAWDGVGLAVGVGDGEADEWEDACAAVGLEFVQLTGRDQSAARNEFGERTGIPRVREALEANDWAQLTDDASDFGDLQDPDKGGDDDDGKDFDPESLDFGYDKADFEGLRAAIWGSGMPQPGQEEGDEGDAKHDNAKDDKVKEDAKLSGEQGKSELDDEDVEKVERMMRRLQAVREAGEGLGYEQRRRMAARAVGEVMKEL